MGGNSFTYRCTKECPWNKHCFVIKTSCEIQEEIPVIHKCKVTGKEIAITIGKRHDTVNQSCNIYITI